MLKKLRQHDWEGPVCCIYAPLPNESTGRTGREAQRWCRRAMSTGTRLKDTLATASQANKGEEICLTGVENWQMSRRRQHMSCGLGCSHCCGVKVKSRAAQDEMPQSMTSICLDGRHFESVNAKLLKSGEITYTIWSQHNISFRNENISKYLKIPESFLFPMFLWFE